METKRQFDVIESCLEYQKEDDITTVYEIFERYGLLIKKLNWVNNSNYDFMPQLFIRMLNLMPNLTELAFDLTWSFINKHKNFTDKLQLNKLKRLKITQNCNSILIGLIADALPENILEEVEFTEFSISRKIAKRFFDKQQSITQLSISGKYFAEVTLPSNLKLTHLAYAFERSERSSSELNCLKKLIILQPNLISLECHESINCCGTFVSDEIFIEICKEA